MKLTRMLIITLILMLVLSSCISSTFFGPAYVEGKSGTNVKKVRSSSVVSATWDKLFESFETEWLRDANGNPVKKIVTEYADPAGRAVGTLVWETEYQQVSGKVLPYRMAVNGQTFIKIDYEVLPVKAVGPVQQDIGKRYFSRLARSTLTKGLREDILLGLDSFPVPLDPLANFVVELSKVVQVKLDTSKDPVPELRTLRYLSLGFDNIVLRRFSFSNTDLTTGILNTVKSYTFENGPYPDLHNQVDYVFEYQWKVINDKICQIEQSWRSIVSNDDITFLAKTEFNQLGDRSRETWSIENAIERRRVNIFDQSIAY